MVVAILMEQLPLDQFAKPDVSLVHHYAVSETVSDLSNQWVMEYHTRLVLELSVVVIEQSSIAPVTAARLDATPVVQRVVAH